MADLHATLLLEVAYTVTLCSLLAQRPHAVAASGGGGRARRPEERVRPGTENIEEVLVQLMHDPCRRLPYRNTYKREETGTLAAPTETVQMYNNVARPH